MAEASDLLDYDDPHEATVSDLDNVLKIIDPDITRWNFWTGIPSSEGLTDHKHKYGTFQELEPWLLEQSRLGHRVCIALGRTLIPIMEPDGQRLEKKQILRSCGIEPHSNDDEDRNFPFTSDNIEVVKNALEYISPDYFDDWKFNVGMPLHDWSGGNPEGVEIWDEWSQATARNNYDRRELLRQWRGFKNNLNPRTIFSLLKAARDNGWPESTAVLSNIVAIPKAKTLQSGSLTDQTMGTLQQRFKDINNRPSLAQWHALRALCTQLEAQANGTAESLLYVCPLDPGVGKTTVIEHFAKHLLASPDHKDVGILILVRTYQDIEDIVLRIGLSDYDWGHVITDSVNDKNRNLHGRGNPISDRARVLFSTHPMLASRAKRSENFRGIKEFFYNGTPRAVRVWDEACFPARPITIKATLIDGMKDAAAKRAPKLYEMFNELTALIANAQDGDFVYIPDFGDGGVDAQLAKDIFKMEKPSVRNAVNDLYVIRGMTVIVRKEGLTGTFVHYENILPDDLKPAVICDASARVNQRYPIWAESRGDLVLLPVGPKDYSNATFNVCRISSSKTAWEANPETLLKICSAAIDERPGNEDWLVFHHKEIRSRRGSRLIDADIPELLRRMVKNPERLRFSYFGGEDCKGTNRHQDVPNVLFAGTPYFDNPTYEALGRLSLALPSDQALSKDVFRRIKQSELANQLFQALCRGTIRKSEGEGCGSCHIYVLADERSGIPRMLENGSIFPGAQPTDWMPIEIVPTGKVAEALDYMREELLVRGKPELTIPEVRQALGSLDASNFNKDVLQHRVFANALRRYGLELIPGRGKRPSMVRAVRNRRPALSVVRQNEIILPY